MTTVTPTLTLSSLFWKGLANRVTGGTWLAIPATWLFNGGMLLANKWYEGYAFADLHPGFEFLVSRRHLVLLFHYHSPDDLDRMGGVAATHVGISFNITMLRLVSFSIDYH